MYTYEAFRKNLFLPSTYLLLMQNVHSDLTLAVAVCIEKKSNKMQ